MSQKIKVQIAGRFYPITVAEGEEELVRIASKSIEQLVNTIESKYSIADKQDALAMAAIQFATKYEIQKKKVNETISSTYEKIEKFNQLIDDSLKEK